MEDYHVLEVIGEGSFGRVYKGRRKFTKQVSFLPVWRLSLSSTCVCMHVAVHSADCGAEVYPQAEQEYGGPACTTEGGGHHERAQA